LRRSRPTTLPLLWLLLLEALVSAIVLGYPIVSSPYGLIGTRFLQPALRAGAHSGHALPFNALCLGLSP
jgi:hypothetical protein